MTAPHEVARWLAGHGFAVFPLRAYGKRPFGNCRACSGDRCSPGECPCLSADRPCHGLLAATTSTAQIARWWQRTPRANVGIHTGRSGLVVLDLDCKPKPAAAATGDVPTTVGDGLEALHALVAAEGADWPDTLTVATPSEGRHLYFRAPADVSVSSDATGRVGHQIDIRAEGGYVVAPECEIHTPPEDIEGTYRRVSTTTQIAELPDWLRSRVLPPQPPGVANPVEAPNPQANGPGEHTGTYWHRVWDDELGKVETRDGERWRLLYAAARRLANLATHDHAPWTETQAIDALVDAAIRRRQRTGKAIEAATARRNATRGWQRGTGDGPDSLHGLGNRGHSPAPITPRRACHAHTDQLRQPDQTDSTRPDASTPDGDRDSRRSARTRDTAATDGSVAGHDAA